MAPERFSRRRLFLGVGSSMAAIGLGSACSSLVPLLQPQATADVHVAPTAQVNATATLVLRQTASIPSTDPFPSGPAVNAFKWAVFNPLVSLDGNSQPVPMLAESWALSDDGRRLTLNLRRGVTFHSGRALTAEAVKWNIEHAQDPKS